MPEDVRREQPQDKLSAVKELFQLVEMAVKTLNLYEGKGESCEMAVGKAFEHLALTVRRYGEIGVSVRPFELYLGRQRVYATQEDRSGITYRLFRDGIRKIDLLPTIDRGEFLALLDILRAVRQTGGEDDSVTLFWEQGFAGVRYEAVDYFLDGSLGGASDDLQEQMDALVTMLSKPLHRQRRVSAARQLLERIGSEIVEQAGEKRSASVSRLRDGADLQSALETIEKQREEMPTDLWRRSMTLITRLLTGEGSAATALLVQVIEQLMLAGRWEPLQAACQILSEHLALCRDKGEEELGRKLDQALGELCADNKLLALHEPLSSCSGPEFSSIAEFVRLLPRTADGQLLLLLRRLPAGESQERMLVLLSERGIDLTDFFRQRLRSADPEQVLGAIRDLRTIGSGSAVAALKAVTNHANPAVRLEAFRALGENVGESLVSRLIESLRLDHPELRELCLARLERVGNSKHAERLLATFRTNLDESWSPEHQRRGLDLLVRWGGEQTEQFIVSTLTAKNPFRRSAVENQRGRMLAAVSRHGGQRARKLLSACLQERTGKKVRESIEQALQAVKGGAS